MKHTMKERSRPKQPHIWAFFVVSLLQYISANFAHPITPTLIKNLQLSDYMFGLAFASMAFTNFLFSPFWGKMREYFSFKWLISIGCVGYGLGQYLFGIMTTEAGIVLARCISGFFVGAIAVVSLIYITEASDESRRGENLAKYVVIQALGAAGGYLLGGYIGMYSIRTTFLLQSVSLMICGVLYYFVIDEGKTQVKPKSQIPSGADRTAGRRRFLRDVNPLKAFWECRSFLTPALAVLFLSVVLASLGTNAFDQSFNYFLKSELHLTPIYNGVLKAATGILTLLFVSTVCLRLMKRKNILLPTAWVLSACTASIVALFVVNERFSFLGISLLFFSFNAIYTPLLQDAVSRSAKDGNRNMMMGFYNATRSLGMICGALIAGFVYQFGPMMPFVLAASCFGAAAVMVFAVSGEHLASKEIRIPTGTEDLSDKRRS